MNKKELNTTLSPQSIDSSNVVPISSGSDEFTEGQNINPPLNPTLGQINEEKKHITLQPVIDERKKSKGRPKQILTEGEKKDKKVKDMTLRQKQKFFKANATAEERDAFLKDISNTDLLNEIIKNHI